MRACVISIQLFSLLLINYRFQETGASSNVTCTTSGATCVFPFIYQNQRYNSCIGGVRGRWCGIQPEVTVSILKEDYDYCLDECPPEMLCTEEGNRCHFPFFYKGKNYTKCIKESGYFGSSYFWCGIDSLAIKWEHCAETCPETTPRTSFTTTKVKNNTVAVPKSTQSVQSNADSTTATLKNTRVSQIIKNSVTSKPKVKVDSKLEKSTNKSPQEKFSSTISSQTEGKLLEEVAVKQPASSEVPISEVRKATINSNKTDQQTLTNTKATATRVKTPDFKDNEAVVSTTVKTTKHILVNATTTHSDSTVKATGTESSRLSNSILVGILIAAVILVIAGIALACYKIRCNRPRKGGVEKSKTSDETTVMLREVKANGNSKEEESPEADALLMKETQLPTVTCLTSTDSGFGSHNDCQQS